MRFILYPLATTLGVVLTAMFWTSVLGAQSALLSTGLSLQTWLLLYTLWALASGVVAWFLSRDISIWSTDTVIFEAGDVDPLVDKVKELAKVFGLKTDPQVGIYPSPEVNVFSAGPWPTRSVLSVSQGFLKLDPEMQTTLLYAEMSKLASGDTALLVFCHGITHGFVLYLARMLAFLLGTSFRQNEGSSSSTIPEIIVSAIATLFLTFLGTLVVLRLAFTRHKQGENALETRFGSAALAKAKELLNAPGKNEEAYDLFTKALKARRSFRFV